MAPGPSYVLPHSRRASWLAWPTSMEPVTHGAPARRRWAEWPPSWRLAAAVGAVVAAAVLAGVALSRALGGTPESNPPALAASSTGLPGGGCRPPYSRNSPWNTPIRAGAGVASDSDRLVSTINQPLTSDPSQFTYPVYLASARRPKRTIRVDSRMSLVVAPNRLHGIIGFTGQFRS